MKIENYLTSYLNVSLLPLVDQIFYINSGLGEVYPLISYFHDKNGETNNKILHTLTKLGS